MPKWNGILDDDFEPDESYTNFEKFRRQKKLDEDKKEKKKQIDNRPPDNPKDK